MIRTVHARFYNNKPVFKSDLFDKIVTIIWNYNHETSLLTYGATVRSEERRVGKECRL